VWTDLILNIQDDKNLVEVWLTNAEKNNQELRDKLKDMYAEYKAKKYTVVVFESGDKDLYQNTLELLIYNKKRCAELSVS